MIVSILFLGPVGLLTLHLLCRPRRRTPTTPTTETTPGATFMSGGWLRTVTSRRPRRPANWRFALGVSQAVVHAVEEEANAARVRLTESDAAVAGTMSLRNAFILILAVFILIALPLL